MPLIRNHAQRPPSGYHFTDPSGVEITGDGIDDLLASIASYRSANGLPPGSPESEVEAYYKTRYPWLVTKVGAVAAPSADPIESWVNKIWRLAPPQKEYVEGVELERRRGTCVTCEHYDEDFALSGEPNRRLMLLAVGAPPMGSCRLHHWACELAVLIRAPVGASQSAPEHCWAARDANAKGP